MECSWSSQPAAGSQVPSSISRPCQSTNSQSTETNPLLAKSLSCALGMDLLSKAYLCCFKVKVYPDVLCWTTYNLLLCCFPFYSLNFIMLNEAGGLKSCLPTTGKKHLVMLVVFIKQSISIYVFFFSIPVYVCLCMLLFDSVGVCFIWHTSPTFFPV